jgi:hypothetical protein
VPKEILKPREVGCQVDAENALRALLMDIKYVTPLKSETEPNPNFARQVDNLGSDYFRNIKRYRIPGRLPDDWFTPRHTLGPTTH